MIKIVRKPKKKECRACGAILKFDKEDIKTVYYDNHEGDDEYICSTYIRCPICKNKIFLA